MALPPYDGATPHAPRPQHPRATHPQHGELVAKLEQIARQRPPAPKGRRIALLVFGLLALGGLIHTFVAGGPVSRRLAQVRTQSAAEGAEPRVPLAPGALPEPAPSAPPAPSPAPAPPVAPPPAPGPEPLEEGLVSPPADALVLLIEGLPAAKRAEARLVVLALWAETVNQPEARRIVLEAAARLAPEAVPEEAEHWARITGGAIDALSAPADTGMALVYLESLHDRGGAPAAAALEQLVDDDRRELDRRCAAARLLPSEARARLRERIGSRPKAHPSLLVALR